MSTAEFQVLINGLQFPESPRWAHGRAWCVNGANIVSWHPTQGATVWAQLPTPLVLGLSFSQAHGLLAMAAVDRQILSVTDDGRHSTVWADLRAHLPALGNELLTLPDGTVLIGGMGFDPGAGEPVRPTRLLHRGHDGTVRPVGPEVVFPNGMALLSNGDLVVAESFAGRVSRLRWQADGSLAALSPLLDRGPIGAHPDGLCVDADDAVWVADAHHGTVERLDAQGRTLQCLRLPVRHATSCALGGDDGRTLFITGTDAMPAPGQPPGPVGVLLATRVAVPAAR